MLLRLCIVLVSVCCASPSGLHSQIPPRRDPNGIAAMSNALAAIGASGLTITPNAGIQVSGTIKQFQGNDEVSYPFRAKILGLDAIRWEVDGPDGMTVTVVRGNSGWTSNTKGTMRLPASQIPGKTLETFPFLALYKWAPLPSREAQDRGTATAGGRAYRRVSVGRIYTGKAEFKEMLESIGRCEILLDPQTHVPGRLRYYEHTRDWRISVEVELKYSDYRRVGGILIPFQIERTIADRPLSRIELTSIDFRASLSRQDFEEK